MKITHLLLLVIASLTFVMPVFADSSTDVVWQLGVLDGKNAEFLPISDNHFLFDAPMFHRPEYDRRTGTFTCKLDKNGSSPTPGFPGGLVTLDLNFVVGDQSPRNAVVEWDDPTGGPVELDIHTASWSNPDYFLPAGRFSFDNYGDHLRVDTPDGGAALFPLPITGSMSANPMGRGEGDLNWRVQFNSKKGHNRLALSTFAITGYKRFYFDCIVLKRLGQEPERKPVVMLSTSKLGNAFFDGEKVDAQAAIYNLPVGKQYKGHFRTVDFFGKLVDSGTFAVEASADGPTQVPIQPKISKRGHFRVTVWLTDEAGKQVQLGQCLDAPILPVAMLAPPEDPGPRDLDSRFGFVGGMSTYSSNESLDDMDRLMKIAYIMGARWHRFDMFSWFMIEPDKGAYRWGPVDAMVDVVRRNNIRIMGELAGTPGWAIENPSDPESLGSLGKFAVPKPDEWAGFVRSVAERYNGKVDAWEYMNEPQVYFGSYKGKRYGEMMKATTPILHSVNPNARVVMGCAGFDEKNRAWTLDAVRASGVDGFDVFTYHYLGGSSPWKFASELMSEAGVLSKPVWDTEQHFAGNSMDEEARQIVREYTREFSYGVEKIFYFDIMKNMVWGSSDMWMSPLMVAHRTLAHRLDHTKFLCALNPAPDIEGYAFIERSRNERADIKSSAAFTSTPLSERHDGRTILVLWNNAAADIVQRNDAGVTTGGQSAVKGAWREARLAVGKSKARLIDMMDNDTPLRSVNGAVQLNLGADPVFVEGIDAATLLAQAAVSCSPAQAVVRSGVTSVHAITVRNVFDKPIRGGLKLTSEPGIKLKAAGLTFSLKPGEAKDFTVEAQTPTNARHKTWRVAVSATLESGQRLSGHFEVLTHPSGPGTNLVGQFGPKTTSAGERWMSDDIGVAPGEFYSLAVSAKGLGKVTLSAQFKDRLGRVLGSRQVSAFAATPEGAKGVGAICTPPGATSLAISAEAPADCVLSDAQGCLLTSGNVNLRKIEYSAVCPKLKQPMPLDGDFDKWEKLGLTPLMIDRLDQVRKRHTSGGLWDTTPYDWRGVQDLSAKIYIAWDANNFYVAAKVTDDICYPSLSRWKDQSLTFGHASDDFHIVLDPDNGAKDVDFYVFTLGGSKVSVSTIKEYMTRQLLPKDRDVTSAELPFIVKPIQGGAIYEAAIPWKLIGDIRPVEGMAIGFDAGMNEVDSDYRGWMEWAPRMLSPYFLDPAETGQITLGK